MVDRKSVTLADLNNGRFDKEPLSWSLNPGYLSIHLFYNVLKERAPRKKGGKLPSVDADSLGKMKHPIADRMLEYRSEGKVLQSFQNSVKFVHPAALFSKSFIFSEMKVVFKFLVTSHDNVERIFAAAKESIPLTLDKGARCAFKVPESTVDEGELSSEVLGLIKYLQDD